MDYFEDSQRIRTEIQEDSQILDVAKRSLARELEPFAGGTHSEVYRVGKLSSGLWVALRTTIFDDEDQMIQLERHCQNAEKLATHYPLDGKMKMPSFCVGVVYGERRGIFTEDLTNGGSLILNHHDSGDPAGYIEEEEERRVTVYVDLDDFPTSKNPQSIKYFLNENIINLDEN